LSGDAALAAAGLTVTGAAGDVIEATERPLDLNRYIASVRSAGVNCAEVVTLTSSHYLKKGSGGFPLLGEHLAAHATLVESALRRIAGTIRKRYTLGKVALAIRLGASYTPVPIRPRRRGARRSLRTFPGASLRRGSLAFNPRPRRLSTPLLTPFNATPTFARVGRALGTRVEEGDLALVIAVSAPRWRDAVDAAQHASSDVKDNVIASIAPQCLAKEPKAAAALAVVAAAAGTSVEEILKCDDSDEEVDHDNSPVPIGAAAAALGGLTRIPSNLAGDDGADVDQPGEGEGEGEEEEAAAAADGGDGDDDGGGADEDDDADAGADAGGAPRNESPAPATPEETANA
jgi:hypothetical protein